MKCPRCGLFNPDYAMRCDCGYDFTKKAVDKSFDQYIKLPGAMQGFFVLQILGVLYFGFHVILTLSGGGSDAIYSTAALAWFAANVILAWQLVYRKNWARYGLVVLTFPLGLLLLSREVRAYCAYGDRDAVASGRTDPPRPPA